MFLLSICTEICGLFIITNFKIQERYATHHLCGLVSRESLHCCRFLYVTQLLATTIQHEKPELEVRKTELLKQEEDLKIQLAKLEESLLEVRSWMVPFHL